MPKFTLIRILPSGIRHAYITDVSDEDLIPEAEELALKEPQTKFEIIDETGVIIWTSK